MNFSTKKIWSRATNRLYTIIYTKLKEKSFGQGENRVKYMLFPRKKIVMERTCWLFASLHLLVWEPSIIM